MEVDSLFRLAAAEAARFRNDVAERPHRPLRGYADSVSVFSEPLPDQGADAEGVLLQLVAMAEPGVRSAILLISIVALTASPFIALIPAMATVRFGGTPALTARFVTAQGIGAVAGALLLPVLADRLGRGRMLHLSLVLLPAALVLYGAAPNATAATAALVLVGATYMFAFSGIGTVVQLRAPKAMRARVLSVYFLALGTLYPVGAALQGPIADRVGLGRTTVAAGIALVGAVGLVALVRPQRLRALAEPVPLAA